MIPGQLGPTSLVFPCVLSISVMRTMSSQCQLRQLPISKGLLTMLRYTLCNAFMMSAFHSTSDRETRQTTSGSSASIASSMPFAATGGLSPASASLPAYPAIQATYGTNMAEAVAPVSLTASFTVAKTGFPRCVSPAFLGFVPPTTLVPCSCQLDDTSLWAKTDIF